MFSAHRDQRRPPLRVVTLTVLKRQRKLVSLFPRLAARGAQSAETEGGRSWGGMVLLLVIQQRRPVLPLAARSHGPLERDPCVELGRVRTAVSSLGLAYIRCLFAE